MKLELEKYWNKGIDFKIYYQSIIDEIENGNPNSDYYSYYSLNLKRIERLKNKIELAENQKVIIDNLNNKINILIITEGWCGDAAQIIPVIEKMDDYSANLETKIVFRDQHPELMDAYLTDGARSIPIIIALDEYFNELFHWGPRPEQGMKLLKDYKAGDVTKEDFQLNLQKFYNQDKGNSIVDELLEKMKL